VFSSARAYHLLCLDTQISHASGFNHNIIFYSLYRSTQLCVQEGTTFSFGYSEAFLSSQETLNKIDAPIIGEGTQLTTYNLTEL
jgi:hypothetical protein